MGTSFHAASSARLAVPRRSPQSNSNARVVSGNNGDVRALAPALVLVRACPGTPRRRPPLMSAISINRAQSRSLPSPFLGGLAG